MAGISLASTNEMRVKIHHKPPEFASLLGQFFTLLYTMSWGVLASFCERSHGQPQCHTCIILSHMPPFSSKAMFS